MERQVVDVCNAFQTNGNYYFEQNTVLGKHVLRFNNGEAKAFINNIVFLFKHNVSCTSSKETARKKINSDESKGDMLETHESEASFFQYLTTIVNVAALGKNVALTIGPVVETRPWLVIVYYNLNSTDNLKSIGILVDKQHFDIGDVLFNHSEFNSWLIKNKHVLIDKNNNRISAERKSSAPPGIGAVDLFALSVLFSGGSIIPVAAAVAVIVGMLAAAFGVLYISCRIITLLPQAYINFNAFGRRIVKMHSDALIKSLVVYVAMDMPDAVEKNEMINIPWLQKYIEERWERKGEHRGVLDLYTSEFKAKKDLYAACGQYMNIAIFNRNKNKHYKLYYPVDNQEDRKWLLLVDDHPTNIADMKSIGFLTKETSLWKRVSGFVPSIIIHDMAGVLTLLNKYKPPLQSDSVIQSIQSLYTDSSSKSITTSRQPSKFHKARRAFGRVKRVFKILKNDGATLSRTGTYTLGQKEKTLSRTNQV